jgi:hypothetical protein
MNARDQQRPAGAVDQPAFERVIRDNLSPEAVATIVSLLEPARTRQPNTEQQRQGLVGAEWLADTLIDLLGVDEYQRLLDEMCL